MVAGAVGGDAVVDVRPTGLGLMALKTAGGEAGASRRSRTIGSWARPGSVTSERPADAEPATASGSSAMRPAPKRTAVG